MRTHSCYLAPALACPEWCELTPLEPLQADQHCAAKHPYPSALPRKDAHLCSGAAEREGRLTHRYFHPAAGELPPLVEPTPSVCRAGRPGKRRLAWPLACWKWVQGRGDSSQRSPYTACPPPLPQVPRPSVRAARTICPARKASAQLYASAPPPRAPAAARTRKRDARPRFPAARRDEHS